MGLVINKAKRSTISLLFLVFGIIGLLNIIFSLCFITLTNMKEQGDTPTFATLFPFESQTFYPITILIFSSLLFYISKLLKNNTSKISIIYEKTGTGILIIIALTIVIFSNISVEIIHSLVWLIINFLFEF